MMKIYKTRWFVGVASLKENRWSRKQDIEDPVLCNAVSEIAAGLFDADLGGGLIKKRVARPGAGKSGGFRVLLATKRDELWIFVYGFSKNERSNIDKDEEKALKEYAQELLSLAPEEIEIVKDQGKLVEVNCHEETEIENP